MASGNNGTFSKFQERLRNIRLSRIKRQKENEQFIQDKVEEIHRVVEKKPYVVAKGLSLEKLENKRDVVADPSQEASLDKIEKSKRNYPDNEDKFVQHVISDINRTAPDREVSPKKIGIGEFKNGNQNQKYYGELEEDNLVQDQTSERDPHTFYASVEEKRKKGVGLGTDSLKDEKLEKLRDEIIGKIQGSFEDKLDELDVLESEIYLLSKEEETVLVMSQIREIRKKINDSIERLNQIIEQYHFYKKNYYMDYITSIDDEVLVDDLIDYKFLLDSLDDEKKFVKEYKNLDEFQRLYDHLKMVKSEVLQLKENTIKKEIEVSERDQKYLEITDSMFRVNKVNQSCNEELERQNEYFSSLMKKVNQIDREEYTTYHLRGLGELVSMSLRYAGLMLMSPFRGFLPGIGLQTIATRRLIGNIRNNLHMEEVRHVHYEAINYDNEINSKLTDVFHVSSMIDDTLKDIKRLREEFMYQYDSSVPGYDDTMDKIDKIYLTIVRNQNKVDKIEKNLKYSKKLNEDKMVRVRKLNEKNS